MIKNATIKSKIANKHRTTISPANLVLGTFGLGLPSSSSGFSVVGSNPSTSTLKKYDCSPMYGYIHLGNLKIELKIVYFFIIIFFYLMHWLLELHKNHRDLDL